MTSPSAQTSQRVLALLGCSGLLLGLAVVELVLRLGSFGGARWQPDDLILRQAGKMPRHYMRPNYAGRLRGPEFDVAGRTNSLGLRGGTPRADGTAPILMLGDSFTFGWGVEEAEAFPALVEHKLGASVINAGVPGYGPFDEAAQMELLCEPLRPVRVVVGFYVGNDALDALYVVPSSIVDQPLRVAIEGILRGVIVPGGGIDERLTRTLKVYLLGKVLAKRVCYRLGLCSFDDDPVLDVHLDAPRRSAAVELSRLALGALRDSAARCGADLVVVMLPSITQVEHADEPSARLAELQAIAAGILEWSGPAGVPVLDLTPAFVEAHHRATGSPLYFRYDNHWTAAGHEFATSTISEFLRLHPRR
jgi:lysophospholipase L1-like esterase